MEPKLTFTMDLPDKPSASFIYGKLILVSDVGNIVFQVSSGLANWQFIGAWRYPLKGCLPSSIITSQQYYVSTNKLWLPKVKGVEGSFYAITPFKVSAGGGITRSDLGIHYDPLGTLGSAGCIVFAGKHKQKHWDIFRDKIKELADKDYKQIPLEVIYK